MSMCVKERIKSGVFMKKIILICLLCFSQVLSAQDWPSGFDEPLEPDQGTILVDDIVADIQISGDILEALKRKRDAQFHCNSLISLEVTISRLRFNLDQAHSYFSNITPADEMTGDAMKKTLKLLGLETLELQYRAIEALYQGHKKEVVCSVSQNG